MPSVDFHREPELTKIAYGADVFEVASKSRPHIKHMLMRAGGVIFCSCEGFQTHGYCWHARKLSELPVVPEEKEDP